MKPDEFKDVDGKTVRVRTYAKFDHKAVSKSKYRNRRVETPDGKFDSKKEYARWCQLKLQQAAGEISNLRRQVRYELIPKQCGYRAISYIADYVYDRDGAEVVEDSKGGILTREYKLKRRLMLWRHRITILET